MQTTASHIFRKTFTFNYPRERRHDFGRFRGVLYLKGMLGEQDAKEGPLRALPPCNNACPANVDARGYINLIDQKKYYDAYLLHLQNNPMPASFGRMCFHPCEQNCRRDETDSPVSIRNLKRFMADKAMEMIDKGEVDPFVPTENRKDKKVAVIGAGPAGLAVAYYLARMGYDVKIFEKLPVPGGMLAIGIPDYRLPRDILNKEVEYITRLGVEIQYNVAFGTDITMESLKSEGYEAVFLGIGAHTPQSLGVEGEEIEGVVPGEDYLADVALEKEDKTGKNVVVIGAGNTALDCARTSLRKGAKVTLVYRRTRKEMPAHEVEVEDAEIEGINFEFLAAPKRFIGENGKLKELECVRMALGEPDASGRRRPVEVEGSEFTIPCDMALKAISRYASFCDDKGKVRDNWITDLGVQLSKWNTIDVHPQTGMTNVPGIFSGGDVSLGPATAIEAIAQGRKAAFGIHAYLQGQLQENGDLKPEAEKGVYHGNTSFSIKKRFNSGSRNSMPTIDNTKRTQHFTEVETGFSDETALNESERCLSCYSQVCIGCQECAKSCPDKCFNIIAQQEDGDREIRVFNIDLGSCAFCGICAEACPTKTLNHSQEYEYATGERSDLVMTKKKLLREPSELTGK